MKRAFALAIAALSGCGVVGADNETFDVFVHDASNDGIANAVVTLSMSAYNDDHVCGKTDIHGSATISWRSCQFGIARCETVPDSVTAAASGYVASTTSIGFSQSPEASVLLEACDAGASCPDPTPCN